ncbi:uncharacterized protein TNIN_162681 [Trichonephila inaurata madagascariensis]|uniref:Uncharacterized protein n=1 Tax=Trichonephila inaurata madagascariensis TaxID=2747483 RepID=A0A8X7CFL1_9ARAC|nr:uncharacterized protein TNIN_162681 [Trichonephila inaurata madagascariensis]
MDLNFDTLLDMELRTPTRPSTPTPTKIRSQLQQLPKEVDQYSTFVRGQQFTIDALKASGIYDPDNPYVKELLNRLYEFTDLHHQAVSEYSSLSPCVIDGCPHHDLPASTPIITILDTQNNSNDFIMEIENSHPTKRKEKSDGFTTPPSSKISKFNDVQPNFQIDLANKFNTLSQETAENNLTTDSASTTIPNIIKAPLPKENTLNAPTLNQNTLNAPTPNYVPPPIMLKVTDTYKQMKIITDKLPSTRGKLTGLPSLGDDLDSLQFVKSKGSAFSWRGSAARAFESWPGVAFIDLVRSIFPNHMVRVRVPSERLEQP